MPVIIRRYDKTTQATQYSQPYRTAREAKARAKRISESAPYSVIEVIDTDKYEHPNTSDLSPKVLYSIVK